MPDVVERLDRLGAANRLDRWSNEVDAIVSNPDVPNVVTLKADRELADTFAALADLLRDVNQEDL